MWTYVMGPGLIIELRRYRRPYGSHLLMPGFGHRLLANNFAEEQSLSIYQGPGILWGFPALNWL